MNYRIIHNIKNQKGLTLVELLAVIVILGIIAAIAVPAVGNIIENSKKDAHIANALMLLNAAKLYEASTPNATFPAVYRVGTTPNGPLKDYVDKLTDPWDNKEYRTAQVEKSDTTGYLVTLLFADNTKDSKCEINKTDEAKLLQGRKAVCP